MLPYLYYLPGDRIRAICETKGRTRGADELIDSMFDFSDRSWMRDFINALRTINQNLIANLLEAHFNKLVEKTKNDPKYKDFHAMYAKACQNQEGNYFA